jgi:PAS domain S-box-containing protein
MDADALNNDSRALTAAAAWRHRAGLRRTWPTAALFGLGVGILYFVGAWVGGWLVAGPGGGSPGFWPPAGLAAAPDRVAVLWPAAGFAAGLLTVAGGEKRYCAAACIFLASLAMSAFGANAGSAQAVLPALVFAIANAGEPLLIAELVRRRFRKARSPDTLIGIVGFVAIAAVAAAIAAALGAWGIALGNHGAVSYWRTCVSWFSADLVGITAIAPLVLAIAHATPITLKTRAVLQGSLLMAALAIAAAIVLGRPLAPSPWPLVAPLATLFPILLLLAARCRPVFAAAAPSVIAVITAWHTSQGVGPFAPAAEPVMFGPVLAAQVFILSSSLCALALSALICERDLAEAALRRSEQRLTLGQEAGGIGVWDWNAARDRAWCSQSYLRLHGLQHLGHESGLDDLLATVHVNDRPALRRALLQGLATGGYAGEYRVVVAGGGVRWLAGQARAIHEPGHPGPRLIGVAYDVTRSKQAEAALRDSEARFRNMADSAPVMIWVTDPAGQCTFLSRNWYEFTGQEPHLALGHGWLDAVHPEEREKARETFHSASARRQPFRIEYRIRRRDGEYRWALDAATPRFAAGGEFLGYIGSVIDISERKSTELALTDSEERLRLAQAAAGIGIHDYDLETGRIRWDARVREIWGVAPDLPITFDVFLAGLHPDDRPTVEGRFRQALDPDGPGHYTAECRVIGISDGTERWISATGQVSFDKRRPVRLVGTVIDITERKQIELHQALLVRELNHRVKNTLATVQSIATQTIRTAPSADAFSASFNGRLSALAAAHDLLTRGSNQSASLLEILRATFAPYADLDGKRVRLAGPRVACARDAVLALHMVFHELATNAAKYGALATPSGVLSVTWEFRHTEAADRRELVIAWDETGGPPVVPPQAKGFGSKLIDFTIPYSLSGRVETRYDAGGVTCRIVLPLPRDGDVIEPR